MQIVIEIPKEMHKAFVQGSFGAKYNMYDLVGCVMNGTPLPDNATNGDMIKALFPNTKIQEGERYTIWDVGTDNVSFWNNWWNAPYKAGDTEESDAEFMCRVMSKTINKHVSDNNFIGGF